MQPPKRPLLSKIPAKEELYHTSNYAEYCSFTRRIKAYGDAGNYSGEDLLHLAVLYLDSTLQGMWESESSVIANPTWSDLCGFLVTQLGDSADRLHLAWNKALRMRMAEGESDYAYLQRRCEQWSELGEDGTDINAILLRFSFYTCRNGISHHQASSKHVFTITSEYQPITRESTISTNKPTARI